MKRLIAMLWMLALPLGAQQVFTLSDDSRQQILNSDELQLNNMINTLANKWYLYAQYGSKGEPTLFQEKVMWTVWQNGLYNEEDPMVIYRKNLYQLGNSPIANTLELLAGSCLLHELTDNRATWKSVESKCLESFTDKGVDLKWRTVMTKALVDLQTQRDRRQAKLGIR